MLSWNRASFSIFFAVICVGLSVALYMGYRRWSYLAWVYKSDMYREMARRYKVYFWWSALVLVWNVVIALAEVSNEV